MNSKSSTPLYIRFGFYSKKSLVYLAIVSFLVDILLPVLMIQPSNYQELIVPIQYAIPYWIITSPGIILFYLTGLYIFREISRLFGIDFHSTSKEDQCRLRVLFRKKKSQEENEPFKLYQKYANKRLRSHLISLIAFIVAVVIVILTLVIPYTLGMDPRINHFPRIVDDENKASIYRIIIIIITINWIWILFSGIGVLLLVLSIGWVFGKMDNYPPEGLIIRDILKKIEDTCQKGDQQHKGNSSGNTEGEGRKNLEEVPKLFMKQFKRRYDDVPNFLTKVSLMISIELFLIVSFITYYGSLFVAYEPSPTVPAYIKEISYYCVGAGPLFVTLLVIISIILLIIAPQWSFHSLLGEVKEAILDTLERLYENKKLQYLEMIHQEVKDRKTLLQELEILDKMIGDVEKISTLPFNENHIITLVSSMIFPFIPLISLLGDILTNLRTFFGI